jgi:hypothetical protein
MGEHYKEREFEIRLTKLEKLLDSKSREVEELKNYVTLCENQILRAKSERQQAIEELKIKIDSISQRLDQIEIDKDPEISFDLRLPSVETRPPTVEKVHKDILLIGDSIIKHVNTQKVSNKPVDLVCLPGARCFEVYSKLLDILKTTDYDQIIVHVGTNSIPQLDARFVSNSILDFLSKLRMLAPNSKISWSSILPKFDSSFNQGINFINRNIFSRFNMIKKMGAPVNHGNFFKKNGCVDPSLFCNDAVHLSYKGVTALEKSLKHHLMK